MTRPNAALSRHLLTRSDLAKLGIQAGRILTWLANGWLDQVGNLPGNDDPGDPVFAVATRELRLELAARLREIGKDQVVFSPLRVRSVLVRAMLGAPDDEAPAADPITEALLDPTIGEALHVAAEGLEQEVLAMAREEARLDALESQTVHGGNAAGSVDDDALLESEPDDAAADGPPEDLDRGGDEAFEAEDAEIGTPGEEGEFFDADDLIEELGIQDLDEVPTPDEPAREPDRALAAEVHEPEPEPAGAIAEPVEAPTPPATAAPNAEIMAAETAEPEVPQGPQELLEEPAREPAQEPPAREPDRAPAAEVDEPGPEPAAAALAEPVEAPTPPATAAPNAETLAAETAEPTAEPDVPQENQTMSEPTTEVAATPIPAEPPPAESTPSAAIAEAELEELLHQTGPLPTDSPPAFHESGEVPPAQVAAAFAEPGAAEAPEEPGTDLPGPSAPAPAPTPAPDAALTAAAMQRVESFLGELRGALVELAQRPAPAPLDVQPIVAAVQQGLSQSEARGKTTDQALATLSERMAQFGDKVEHGVALAVHAALGQRGETAPRAAATTTYVMPRQDRSRLVLFAIGFLLVCWATVFWFKTGNPKLALSTLVGANVVGCCLLLGRRPG